MNNATSKMYSYHVANLRELELAISHTARIARAEIASNDPQKSLQSMLRLYSFLVGAWAECRLLKLLHEANGFSDAERTQVIQRGSQLDQWKEAVDLAFRKHHGVPKAPLVAKNIGVAHAARRDALQEVLSNELRIVIEIRNKLAHGQWVYPFNNECTAVEAKKYQLINKENLQSLQFKYALVGYLADAVHDLVVSPATFERDFEDHFKKLFQTKINLKTKSYLKYEAALQKRRQIARANRRAKI